MGRVQLVFEGISEVVGNKRFAVITLTDTERKHYISIVCDDAMKGQLTMRCMPARAKYRFLPEVMVRMLSDVADMGKYEIVISDISDGEYKAAVINTETFIRYDIRLSDAILLSQTSGIPIYIDEQLMQQQSSQYQPNPYRMSIPINTLDMEKLTVELDNAIKSENYRLASYIKKELDRRKKI